MKKANKAKDEIKKRMSDWPWSNWFIHDADTNMYNMHAKTLENLGEKVKNDAMSRESNAKLIHEMAGELKILKDLILNKG